MEDKIFAIIRILYGPISKDKIVHLCGTCFFIERQKFITANHCFNNDSFSPMSNYSRSFLMLANSQGKIIYNPIIDKLYPDYDLAIGKIDNELQNFVSTAYNSKKLSKGEEIYNLGYPYARAVKNIDFKIKNNNLLVKKIELNIETQRGFVDSWIKMSCNTIDIKFQDKEVAILNYSSEQGFSGGPLILKNHNQIVGFMSLILPQKNDPLRRACAMPIFEVNKFII